MFDGHTINIQLDSATYEIVVTPLISDFTAINVSAGGAAVTDPDILSKLYGASKALLYAEHCLTDKIVGDTVMYTNEAANALTTIKNLEGVANFTADLSAAIATVILSPLATAKINALTDVLVNGDTDLIKSISISQFLGSVNLAETFKLR